MTLDSPNLSTYTQHNSNELNSDTYSIKPMKVPTYRDMTIETHTTHMAKLKQLNIDPMSLDNQTVLNALNTIKKSGRSGSELSNGYINGIYSTMRRINPSLNKSASKLGFPRKNRKTLIDDRLAVHIGIKQLVETILKFVLNFNTIEPRKIESRRITDTIIAVILTLLTNLRTTELFNLQIKHLSMIANEQPIKIQTKHQTREFTVMKLGKLYDLLYPNLVNLISSREIRCNTDYLQSNKFDPINEDTYLLSCKNDTVNKTFYELYIRINQQKPNVSMGLKTIRSFNLTVMFDPDELLIVHKTMDNNRSN